MPNVLFPAGSLALQRQIAEDAMTEPCVVLDTQVAGTPDGYGGTVPGEPVPRPMRHPYCRISPVRGEGRERVLLDRLQAMDVVRVALAWDQAVAATDRLQVRGRAWEIVEIVPLSSTPSSRAVYASAAPEV